MIAERPDIGACYCGKTPCVCPPFKTRIHLLPCADPLCPARRRLAHVAAALGHDSHMHECPGCEECP